MKRLFRNALIGIVLLLAEITTAKGPLPELPSETAHSKLSQLGRIYVHKFVFNGNTVFPDETLSALVVDYENRHITAEELQDVRRIISKFYLSNGYVNSGAILPDQHVKEGIVALKIIEGKLSRIEVTGNARLRSSYIVKRVRPGSPDSVLNINDLQNRLKLLKQNPLIKQIGATLSPDVGLGAGILKVDVKEEKPYHLNLIFNNHRSTSLGEKRAEIEAGHHNLTGWGGRLDVRYGLTEGLKDYTVSYAIPITRWDTTLKISHEENDATVVSEPLNRLDIESESSASSIALRHPFYKTTSRDFSMDLKLEKRHSETFLLGRPFSFVAGVQNGESNVSVLRISQDYVDRGLNQVLAVHSCFSFGLNLWNATINEDGPDGRFTSWLGQFRLLRQIGLLESRVLLRTDIRLSKDPLLPLEKFAIGGASTVRGYMENLLIRDNGIITSLEWLVPIGKISIPWLGGGGEDGVIRLAPFVDYGWGWDTETHTPHPRAIGSIGLGIKWNINQKSSAEIYWGRALRKIDDVDDKIDLQDDGIHFNILISAF